MSFVLIHHTLRIPTTRFTRNPIHIHLIILILIVLNISFSPHIYTILAPRTGTDDDEILQHQHHNSNLLPHLDDDHHRSAMAAAAAATINALHLLGATDEHGAPLFRCHRCGRAYKTKYTCRRHERVECGLPAMYSCSLCNYRAKHKHSVKQHYDCVHKKKLTTLILKSDM